MDDDTPITPAEFGRIFAAHLAPGETALLAVSGGPDSMALLHALARCRAGPAAGLAVATVDHGLRSEARAEAEAVARVAGALALPHHLLSWDPPSRPVGQAAARRARYGLLADLAGRLGTEAVVTAHHRDDQAETLLMRMAAGSGLAGLAGMRPLSRSGAVVIVRPFLAVPKARLVATCRAEGWPYATDPSNRDTRHARTRWRDLAPLLAKEGLDAARLARLSDRAARADDALERVAERAFAAMVSVRDDGALLLDGPALAGEPAEIALRVLALALAQVLARAGLGGQVRLERLERCLSVLLAPMPRGEAGRRLTLAGRLLSLGPDGQLTIVSEAPRRRGGPRPVTAIAAGAPHSLGRDGDGA